MSVKDLLVHLDVAEGGQSVSDFALSLAAQTGAHLTGAGLALQLLMPDNGVDTGAYEILVEFTEDSRKQADAAYERLSAAAPAGVQTDYVLIQAYAPTARQRFGELGRHFDFSIVGQGASDLTYEEGLMVEGALLHSGRPVFVVPSIHKGPAQLGKALVCWDGGAPAARALAGALPLLKAANVVEVVEIMKQKEQPEELPGFNITRHLARHGVKATLTRLPSAKDVGAALLSHAADVGAEFMVMGGYGHWRVREFIFGGTTQTILASMTIPVLMSH